VVGFALKKLEQELQGDGKAEVVRRLEEELSKH
jgi:hypothetical protein